MGLGVWDEDKNSMGLGVWGRFQGFHEAGRCQDRAHPTITRRPRDTRQESREIPSLESRQDGGNAGPAFPSLSQHFPAFPGLSQHFPAFPGLSQPFPAFPSLSQHFPAFPSLSQPFPAFSSISQPFPAFPSISQHFPAFPSLSQPFPAFPSLSQPFPAFPSLSQHFPAFPSISQEGTVRDLLSPLSTVSSPHAREAVEQLPWKSGDSRSSGSSRRCQAGPEQPRSEFPAASAVAPSPGDRVPPDSLKSPSKNVVWAEECVAWEGEKGKGRLGVSGEVEAGLARLCPADLPAPARCGAGSFHPKGIP
ncbi:uncharacterized protein LOC131587836 [Poecile atricapillus]|uniref:uncharacterized protein LOC131587836 n=1 Tax=Poecile atricapillus TaxID=48891 RepID=UPI0027393E85|nr:uncharacterized protein LOC131587836 [Poecile atricapillus]